MYQAGEFIVYGTNSVCRVESIGKPPFETEEDKLYYTLVPVTGTETIYIPTDSPVFTRPVISREKAEELINSIPDIEEDHFVCHSVRMANEHYQAALQSHDCEELVQLIKTVYAKSRRHGRRVCAAAVFHGQCDGRRHSDGAVGGTGWSCKSLRSRRSTPTSRDCLTGTRCWGRCASRESSATIRFIPRGTTILR